MSNSLQDQLLALGLAKNKPEKKSKAARKPASSHHKSRPARKKKNTGGELTLEQAYALKKQDEKKQADLARKKKQEEDRRRKELNNAIREIVKANRLNLDDAEISRNFMFRGRIRKVHVSPEQLKALNAGEMGIAYLSGGYHLLTKKHADAVRRLSADHVPDLSAGSEEDDGEFPIPDDLIW